jgi:hypothetical protein
MAVTHGSAIRIVVADAVVDALDAGTPPGFLVFQTSGDATVCTITLANTAFGAANGSAIAAMAGTPKTSDGATAGTIAKAKFTNAAGTSVILCAVSTSGSDINIAGGLTLATSDTVTVTSLTYTAMP